MSYLNSHSPPLLHRDLKPRNVLLSSRADEKPHVVICDFGLCKLFCDDDVDGGRGGGDGKEMMGTASYMSPNVLAGGKFCVADDVCSFGVVLWELLTGRVPFEGMRPIQIIFGVSEDGLRPEVRAEDGIDGDLLDLLEGCWREEPGDRPGMKDVLLRLDAEYAQYGEVL